MSLPHYAFFGLIVVTLSHIAPLYPVTFVTVGKAAGSVILEKKEEKKSAVY